MGFRTFYDGLLNTIPLPVKQFASGVAAGVGIPQSMAELSAIPASFGQMLAGPSAAEMSQGPKPLIEALKRLPAGVRTNPAGAAGMALGMAVPLGPGEFSEAMKFGGKALSNAERRMSSRATAAQARLHMHLEGKTGPLEPLMVAPTESATDILINMPSASLQAAYKHWRGVPQYSAMIAHELGRRGLKPDIADELQILHEGTVGPPPSIFTREERGMEMLNKEGWSNREASYMLAGPVKSEPPLNVLRDLVHAEQDPLGDVLRQLKTEQSNTPKTGIFAGELDPRHYTNRLNAYLGTAPTGTTMSLHGIVFTKAQRGWMRLDRPPQMNDIGWIFNRFSNPDKAVEAMQEHGGTYFGATSRRSRAVVANNLYLKIQEGTATPEEAAWWNIWKTGLRPPQ